MRLGSLRYLVRQGWRSMGANRLMTLAGIGVLTVCFIITGIAALLSVNVIEAVDYLYDQNEVRVDLADTVGEDQTAILLEDIRGMSNIAGVEYVSKDDAFAVMEEMMSSYGNLLDGYDKIFPASFMVTVEDLNYLEPTCNQLRALPGVEQVLVPIDFAEIMLTVTNAVTYGGLALVIILAVVSVIVINNTIRLTVFARRREISIMKYVGATNAFIRLPFFVEGMTVGLVAGILATAILCGLYYLIYNFIVGMNNVLLMGIVSRLLTVRDIWLPTGLALMGAGAVLGGFGTGTSVRKHLKV